MMGNNVNDEIRLSLVPLLQELIPSIDINDQSKANYVLYLFDFVFTNSFFEDSSSVRLQIFSLVFFLKNFYKIFCSFLSEM